MCRIRCSPPGNLGNHTGRLAVYKPFTGSPKVLLITTQGRPTHLTCGQTIMRIIIPRPRSWRKGKLLPLSGQNASLKTNNTNHHPTNKWEAVCMRLVMALFPKFVYNKLLVARSGGNVPAWLVFGFQATRRTFLFPRSPYSPGKSADSFMLQKIFLIFF